MFWWNVSQRAVWAWRKSLGVGRMDSEGSQRLILAAAEAGGAVVRGQKLLPEQVERRRRTAFEMNLGRNLITGFHGPRWTKKDLALLGKIPDNEVARRTGRTPDAVRQKREELGRPNPAGSRWTEEEVGLLGTMTDGEVAKKLVRSQSAITQKRIKLDMTNLRDGRRVANRT